MTREHVPARLLRAMQGLPVATSQSRTAVTGRPITTRRVPLDPPPKAHGVSLRCKSSNACIPTELGVGGPAPERAPTVPVLAAAAKAQTPRRATGKGVLESGGGDPLTQGSTSSRNGGPQLVGVVLGRENASNEHGGVNPEADGDLEQGMQAQVPVA